MSARKKQGWINYYRKPCLSLASILFVWMWIFTDPIFTVPNNYKNILAHIGIITIFLGIIGRIVASFSISGRKNKQVINSEIYATVRHPLYFFSFLIVLGANIIIARIDLTIFAIVIYLLCFIPMMKNEEKYLEGIFKKEYIDYKKHTSFFIPDFNKFKVTDKEISINPKLVMRTIYDGLIALLILPAIDIVEFLKNTI